VLAILFKLDTLSIKTQASSLGLLIPFVNNFHFNLVVMFVYFENQSSIINSIYSDKLVLLIEFKGLAASFQAPHNKVLTDR